MLFSSYAVAAAAILGAAAGAAASRGLQGKRTPKAYIVTEVELTGDREVYQRDYAQYAQSTVEPFGGHYLARGGRVLGTEGEPPKARVVISEFPSFEAGVACFESPQYRKAAAHRRSGAGVVEIVMLEALEPGA